MGSLMGSIYLFRIYKNIWGIVSVLFCSFHIVKPVIYNIVGTSKITLGVHYDYDTTEIRVQVKANHNLYLFICLYYHIHSW